jgi:NhaP-type Na+/H+ or K+/H+ antiporter/mannitol/fructose-specific phosphotransferase system IIA component (Ntr-type)
LHDPILTLSVAVAAGASLVAIGSRLRIPYIVLLLFGGVALGPEALGVVQPEALHEGLEVLVALAVAVILFEGGLTLDLDGYRRAPVVIRRLLTLGALITWLGTGAAAHFLFGFGPGMSLMLGSLVIVTGPTVISPLLRRLDIDPRLHHVLYWEGVLIDAVGVFVAVLCFEWLSPNPALPVLAPLARFGIRVLLGVAIGVVAGLVIAVALSRNLVPEEHAAIFALGLALLSFGVSHWLLHETGTLVAVVAGLVVAWRRPRQLKRLKRFKLQVTELAIGVVFVLLAAKLELDRFRGWRLAALVGVVLLLRPVSVALATWGQGFRKRERAFLSWIAPRGIVAASMASLFSLRLEGQGHAEATMLETGTYAVIAVTVTLQGLSAPWLARILRLKRPERDTWALVGDETLVSRLGASLRRAGIKVVEHTGDLDGGMLDDPRFTNVRALLCVNATMLHNVWAAHQWSERSMQGVAYQWATGELDHEDERTADGASKAVWGDTLSPAAAIDGLMDGSASIDVVDLGRDTDPARFDESFRPLFWIDDGRADLVEDLAETQPHGTHAVVLRRRIPGLSNLVAHVEVIDGEEPSFEETTERLLESASRLYPDLPTQEVFDGIVERRKTMPTAVGRGVSIPHAFWGGIEESRCFIANVPNGVADMTTPDGEKVRLVFLLLSPLGGAQQHLEALATLARLAQTPAFVELLSEQKVPERLARFIMERG